MLNGTGSNPFLMLLKICLINGKNVFGTNFSKRLPPFCVTFRRIRPCPFIERWRAGVIRLGAIENDVARTSILFIVARG